MKTFCRACNTYVPSKQIQQHKYGRRHQHNTLRIEENEERSLWKLDPQFMELEMMFPQQVAPLSIMQMDQDIYLEVIEFFNCALLEDEIECELSEESFGIFVEYFKVAKDLNNYEQQICKDLDNETLAVFMSKILKNPEWDLQGELHKLKDFGKLNNLLDSNDILEAETTIQHNYNMIVTKYMDTYEEAKDGFERHSKLLRNHRTADGGTTNPIPNSDV